MGLYFRLIQSRLHPTPSGRDPHLGCLLNTPLQEKKYSQLPPTSAAHPSLRRDQSFTTRLPRNSEPECRVGERQVEPSTWVGGKRGGQAGAGGTRLPGGGWSGWVRSLTGGERALGLGRESHISPWVLGPTCPTTPHSQITVPLAHKAYWAPCP